MTFAIGLCISLFAGYYTTSKALERAEKSGSVADKTLTQIFNHVSSLSPSEKNTELLSNLLPYYQIIVAQENLSKEKLYNANLILASTAMQVGKYDLAENAYKELLEVNKQSPKLLNQLATSLAIQNKVNEARTTWEKVVSEYTISSSEQDLSEVVKALLSLSEEPNSKERNQAFKIIQELLKKNPQNPEYLFQYAQLLIGDPKLTDQYQIDGKKPNPRKILFDLANKYPNNKEYCIALLKLQEGRHHPIGFGERNPRKRQRQRYTENKQNNKNIHSKVNFSNSLYDLSERMLWLWPNDPEVVNAVLDFQTKAIESQETQFANRNKFLINRLINLIEKLYYNPEISIEAKETLVSKQFELINNYTTDKPYERVFLELQLNLIERELQLYNGEKKSEFENQLNTLRNLINHL